METLRWLLVINYPIHGPHYQFASPSPLLVSHVALISEHGFKKNISRQQEQKKTIKYVETKMLQYTSRIVTQYVYQCAPINCPM